MTKQKNEKEKKKAWSNQRLFKTKMEGNTLPQNGIEVGKKRTNSAGDIRILVFRLLSVCTDLQIGYSSKLNFAVSFLMVILL